MQKTILSLFVTLLAVLPTVSSGAEAFTVEVRGRGRPMLLIPGTGCGGAVWDETVRHYEQRFECHVVTLAGFAGVPPLDKAPYLETHRDALIAYLRDKIRRRAVLVGHSVGGFLSLWMASIAPELTDGVIIIDGLPFLPALANPAAKPVINPALAEQYLAMMQTLDPPTLAARKMTVLRNLVTGEERQKEVLAWSLRSDLRTEAWTLAELMGTDLRQNLSRIDSPVLVLAPWRPSRSRPEFTRAQLEASYREQYAALPKVDLRVKEGSSHFLMFDATDWLFQQMDQFLAPTIR